MIHSLALALALALASASKPVLADSHGGQTGNVDNEERPGPSTGAPLVMPLAQPKAKGNGDGKTEKNPSPPKGPPRGNKVEPERPLFVFAAGPYQPGGAPLGAWVLTQRALVDVIRKRVSEATVVELPELSLAALASAVPAGGPRVTSATVVLQGNVSLEGRVEAQRHWRLLTAAGSVTAGQLGDTLGQLSKRLGLAVVPLRERDAATRAATHTIFLTGHSGGIDCGRFPGPVFGMTAAEKTREGATLERWLEFERTRPMDPFPLTARDWFNAWRMAVGARGLVRHWYCPHRNPAGYLGEKFERPEPGDAAWFLEVPAPAE